MGYVKTDFSFTSTNIVREILCKKLLEHLFDKSLNVREIECWVGTTSLLFIQSKKRIFAEASKSGKGQWHEKALLYFIKGWCLVWFSRLLFFRKLLSLKYRLNKAKAKSVCIATLKLNWNLKCFNFVLWNLM